MSSNSEWTFIGQADPALVSASGDILSPLVALGSITDLFWEERRTWRLEIGGMIGRPTDLHVLTDRDAGASLRCVSGQTARTAWTCGQVFDPLMGSFEELAGRTAPLPNRAWRRLPPCPNGKTWSDFIRAVHAKLPAPSHIAHLSLAAVVIDGVRGVSRRPGEAVEWGMRHAALRLRAIRSDGTTLISEQVLEQECGDAVEAWSNRLGFLLCDDAEREGGMEGAMPVITAAGCGAVLFHELIGHPLEADFARSKDLFGPVDRAATHQDLSIEDRSETRFGPGAIAIDDEGKATEAVTLVSRGRICGELHDRVTAADVIGLTKGNGRRQDYRHAPRPRMRNIVVASGSTPKSAMLAEIRRGLLIERFGAAHVEPESGRFAIRIERAIRIRNGHPDGVLRGLRITGRVRDALRSVEAVGDDYAVCPEVVPCEKNGLVITGVAGPSIRFERLSIFPS